MTETPQTPPPTTPPDEPQTGPIIAPAAHPNYPQAQPAVVAQQRRPSRLNIVAAWVGIVAGVVFVVAVIFGTGYLLGANSGGHRGGGGPGPGPMMIHRDGPPPPMLFPMGPRAQFEFPGGPNGPAGPAPGPGAQPPR
ncbi:hypothetical protein ACN27E_20120 [Mycobacterium sp. WMMD1722]|uniref:hypothetical protein n=1 Tax=Mycobacterium sp. WMMD1722 TaxID=3404117 RepID=UPI003BF46CFD